jgi:hypothetical protein
MRRIMNEFPQIQSETSNKTMRIGESYNGKIKYEIELRQYVLITFFFFSKL